MTSRDFIFIARTLQNVVQMLSVSQGEAVVKIFCRELAKENPRFDEGKFRKELATFTIPKEAG